jgi:hypothetical protein
LLATLGYDLSGRLVTISDDTIAGRRVRCFTVGAASGPVQLCATPTGIPVRIAGGSVSFELTKLDSSVPTAIFRVPAPDSK